MSYVPDAVALVAARHWYNSRADALERQAYESANPKERNELRYRAKIARRAAIAELTNPETPK